MVEHTSERGFAVVGMMRYPNGHHYIEPLLSLISEKIGNLKMRLKIHRACDLACAGNSDGVEVNSRHCCAVAERDGVAKPS